MTTEMNASITPGILIYNENSYSYELNSIDENASEEVANITSSIKKVFTFQDTLSGSQREQI
jgi:hypothetical protein